MLLTINLHYYHDAQAHKQSSRMGSCEDHISAGIRTIATIGAEGTEEDLFKATTKKKPNKQQGNKKS